MDPESIIREASVAVGAFGWVQKDLHFPENWGGTRGYQMFHFFLNEGFPKILSFSKHMYIHIYSLSYSTFWSWHNRAQYLVKGVSENKIEGFKNNNREMDNAPGPGRQIWARH